MIDWLLEATSDRRFGQNRLGILYDIGCNLEKGILKVSFLQPETTTSEQSWPKSGSNKRELFSVERLQGRLKIGTSVFHAYVHEWLCQLQFNPRLNAGWGLSDGEGSERVWWDLAPLVRVLRYATQQNRLVSIDLKALYGNERLLTDAGKQSIGLQCSLLYVF